MNYIRLGLRFKTKPTKDTNIG